MSSGGMARSPRPRARVLGEGLSFPRFWLRNSRKAPFGSAREASGKYGRGNAGGVDGVESVKFDIHLSLVRQQDASATSADTTLSSKDQAGEVSPPIPSLVHIDLDVSYDENIIRLTKEMGVALEADDDQLGYIFSLQHIRASTLLRTQCLWWRQEHILGGRGEAWGWISAAQ